MKLFIRTVILFSVVFVPKSFFSQEELYVDEIDHLQRLSVIYLEPDLRNPMIVFPENATSGSVAKRISISDRVHISQLNENGIRSTEKYYSDMPPSLLGDIFPRNCRIEQTIQVDSFLVSLAQGVRIYKDLLLWKRKDDKFYLTAIYPSSIGVCLYCKPKFVYQNKDTVIIGQERDEEGSINGSYHHIIVRNDSLFLYWKEIINGHSPYIGNPISGATTKRIANIYYDRKGNVSDIAVQYISIDKNGNPILFQTAKDSIHLYELTTVYETPKFIRTVKASQKYIQVGERTTFHLPPKWFISALYNGDWYWIPEEDIKLER